MKAEMRLLKYEGVLPYASGKQIELDLNFYATLGNRRTIRRFLSCVNKYLYEMNELESLDRTPINIHLVSLYVRDFLPKIMYYKLSFEKHGIPTSFTLVENIVKTRFKVWKRD